MEYRLIENDTQIAAAAALSKRAHDRLATDLPFLPPRAPADFAFRIGRAASNGMVMGAFTRDETLAGFLGGFGVEDFRNLGRGFYAPDFCHGFAGGTDGPELLTALYRSLAPELLKRDIRVHAAGCYASEPELASALVDVGFGRIVMDAAAPTTELRSNLGSTDTARGVTSTNGIRIRRAGEADAATLERLNASLADHIGASPIFFPEARGTNEAGWRAWLADSDHFTLMAERDGEPLGYIKAEAPAFDVSYAVHDETDLGINGMFVTENARRLGVGGLLLDELARTAEAEGKRMLSVDFESSNPEARGFWTRWFDPVTYSYERRL